MKKLMIGLFVLTMLITLCGCGDMGEQLKDNIIEDAQFAIDNDPSIDKELTQDIVDALKGENEEHIQFVKGGTNTAYPGVTYEEAFENFFTDPSWKYFKGTQEGPDDDGDGEPDYTIDDVDVVEFTGRCLYADTEVTALIQFVLDTNAGTFEPTFLSFNDVPQSVLMLAGLMEKVFTQAQEDLGISNTTPPPSQDEETTPPSQNVTDDPSSDPGDVSGNYYTDSQNGYYVELDNSNPSRDGTFGFIIDGEKYLGGDLFRITQSDYSGETTDGIYYEFHFYKPNDSMFMEVTEAGTFIGTVERDAKFLEGDYSGYNLYTWQGDFYEDTNGISISLLVLPNEIEYFCKLDWNYGLMVESGDVSPGVPTELSEGTVITIDLNQNGTISVILEQDGSNGFHYEFEMHQ